MSVTVASPLLASETLRAQLDAAQREIGELRRALYARTATGDAIHDACVALCRELEFLARVQADAERAHAIRRRIRDVREDVGGALTAAGRRA